MGMMEMLDKEAETQAPVRRVIRTALVWRVAAILFAAVGIPFILSGAQQLFFQERVGPFEFCVGLYFIVWSTMALYGAVAQFQMHLIISQQGLEYHTLGWHVFADWNDIESIGPWGYYPECITLRRFRVKANRLVEWATQLLGQESIIPLAVRGARLWEKDVVPEILQYTSHSK